MKSPKAMDVRTPEMRQREQYFGGLMSQPGWGYDVRRGESLMPAWARASERAKQGIAGRYADIGLGGPGQGVMGSALAAGETELGAQRAQSEVEDRARWEQMVLSGGQGTPMQIAQPRPSGFAQLAGTVAGAALGPVKPWIMG